MTNLLTHNVCRSGPRSRGSIGIRFRLGLAYLLDGVLTLAGLPSGYEGCAHLHVEDARTREVIFSRATTPEDLS